MGKVLIIDDHLTTCTMLQQLVERIGHQASYSQNLTDGLLKLQSEQIDVVFLDVNMPDGNGLDALADIRNMYNPPEVIIITGAVNQNGAEIAIKNGAWGYLQKPLSPKEIILPVKRVLEYRENLTQNSRYLSLVERKEIVGNSSAINGCLEKLARSAENDSNVLLTGETGTGKGVFAKVLHANSKRAINALVTVDCASLPENLVADTLFGHEKGAYTGADRKTVGLVKLADGGSLFLDEIGDLDLGLQKTLLRVLQEKQFIPIGSNKEVSSDFRLIAATNRDLKKMISDGQFREDLYYRINSQSINLPPLRNRQEDIEVLIVNFVRKVADKYEQKIKGYSPDYLETLYSHAWPGNIRELLHVIEDSFHTAGDEPILFSKHLPEYLRIQAVTDKFSTVKQKSELLQRHDVDEHSFDKLPSFRNYRERIQAEAEKKYLNKLMTLSSWDIKSACVTAKIGRTHLYNLLKKYNISRNLAE